MNAEPPTARFQVEHQPRRPGYAGRYFAVAHVDTNPYKATPTLDSRNGIVRSMFALCFGSLLRTTTFGAMILFLFVSLTFSRTSSSTSWSNGAVGHGHETREFGVFPVVVIESTFDIEPDGVRRFQPTRFSLQADPVHGACFLGAVTLLSLIFSLILYPFWRRWAL